MRKAAPLALFSFLSLMPASIVAAQTVGGLSLDALIEQLNDGLPVTRAMAAMQLAACRVRCAAALPAVRQKFAEGNDETMVNVALSRAIVCLDPQGDVSDIVDYLIRVVDGGLNGQDDRQLERAIQALGEAGPRASVAIPVLQAAQNHWAGSVKSDAFAALQKIQGGRY